MAESQPTKRTRQAKESSDKAMASKRKICFVSLQARGAFFPDSRGKIGGAEVQVRLLAKWLARQGDYEPVVIVEDAGQPEREQVDGVTLRKIHQPPAKKGRLSRLWRLCVSGVNLWRAIRAERPSVTVQRGEGVETGLAEHAAHSVGSAFIFMTSHDTKNRSLWLEGRWPTQRLFRRGMARADGVICQHAGQIAPLQSHQLRQPPRVLASLYDFTKMETAKNDAVLWIERCVPYKNPLAYLDLARALPDVPFLMVAMPTEHEPELFARVKAEADALPNVTLIPGVPRNETTAIYRQSSVLVNTSLREGMPNVFLEATQYGLALASLNVDPGGIFSEKEMGVFAGGDMGRLIGEVEGLMGDPARRTSIARRTQDFFHSVHHIDTVGPQLVAFLEKLS